MAWKVGAAQAKGRSIEASLPDALTAREHAQGAAFEDSPKKWLEHIARLRDEGHDAEADESLAEFRRRYPDYRTPEEMRAKVLRR